jgi:alpha-galactosidase
MKFFSKYILQIVLILGLFSPVLLGQETDLLRINGKLISIDYDSHLHSRIISNINGEQIILGDFSNSEFLIVNGEKVSDFNIKSHSVNDIENQIGKGKEYKIIGISGDFKKELNIKSYEDFPSILFFSVKYYNIGKSDLTVDGWTNNRYKFSAVKRKDNKAPFWSYQPGSYGWANDWLQQIHKGFERENYMGMNWVDYGGGTPIVDIWRQDVGIAVGHTELTPKFVSLPTQMPNNDYAIVGISYQKPITLKAGKSCSTFNTFVAVHHGDCFQALLVYRKFMIKQGIEFHNPPLEAHESIWCGWGYGENFTIKEIYDSFPKIKKLGLKWVVLDYGWENGLGDYIIDRAKFPAGDLDMKKLVDSIHSIGAKAKLWINPLSVSPCSDLFQNHSEDLLINKDGSPVYIQFWKSFFLCPASEKVKNRAHEFIVKVFKDWGFDGLKIDGNNLNCVPACYNPEHHHAFPEESLEQLPEFFKIIYETAININPHAVIEICPCGTNYSFYLLPYMNQSVASDPTNSWQIRLKGKILRALGGDKIVFYGDHVELSDDANDFASSVGVGAVIGTKFTWPNIPTGPHEGGNTVLLTYEKEKLWSKWMNIFKENNLSYGNYLGNLYDIGYDRPETHVIQKGDTLYYAFYSDNYEGKVELRGLMDLNYSIKDYVNDKMLGIVKGPVGNLNVVFKKYLLLKAIPD